VSARVKVCGVMRGEDARVAAEAGASAIGLILWPGSRRAVSVERAAQILEDVPAGVMKVGVFVDQSPAFVESAVRRAGLDAVQLHGRENPAEYNVGALVLKSVPVGEGFDARRVKALPSRVLPLLDAADEMRKGGTGMTIDWDAAAAAAAIRPIVLAGGLTAANVREAIRLVRPFAVDVSSGVESAAGLKSVALIHAFMEAVRAEAGEIQRGEWS
jgi:phosphoribosylanthranilate isomerase